MEVAKATVEGAWADLPAGIWAQAAGLARGSDLEKRIALLLCDNAVEIALRSYFEISVGTRGGPRVEWDRDPTFWHLVDGYEKCFPAWPDGVRRGELLWLHSVRNSIHHGGNGLVPDSRSVATYLTVARLLIDHLFGPRAIEEALLEESLRAVDAPTRDTEDSRPDLVRGLDELIEALRTLMDELPPGAPAALAVPPNTLDAAREAEEVISEIGFEWSDAIQESTIDFLDWDFVNDGLPESAEDSLSALQRLRHLLRFALM